MSVVIETTLGDITVDLFTEDRPVACLNFMKLCKLKYYNFNLFHSIQQGFIAQTGDPTGAGDGGSSVWGVVEGLTKRFFEAESLPKIKHTCPGLLSLVSVGKHLVGSQFFFTLGSDLTFLDEVHCVIGEVSEGHETLRKLNEAIVDEKFRPFQDIRITHTVVLDDPFPDPRGFRVPSRSPSPSAERLANGRIGADEEIDDTNGKTMEEIQEMIEEREAKARATILEIVGDLPHADVAPPENVLFVCKLNPITTDDDLEIIFSRFGKVNGCEVIRDKKSGDSLQYAFVEFEEKESCEEAYLKMDNVLIDDRRIHVDFSQSVAKVKWRGKGRGVDGMTEKLDFNNLREEASRHSRARNDAPNRQREGRERLTSEERRNAREERHRVLDEKEKREKGRRSRSRGRGYCNDERIHHNIDRRIGRGGKDDYTRQSSRRNYRENDSYSRHSERDRKGLSDRHSPEKRRHEVDSYHRDRDNRENHNKTYPTSDKYCEKYIKNKDERLKKPHAKKRKVVSRSDDSSSDSSESNSTSTSSSTESSSETSSSTSSSSSEEKRKRSKKKRRSSNKKRRSSNKKKKSLNNVKKHSNKKRK